MADYEVNEQELMQLNVGDFIAVLTNRVDDSKTHWTLGTVESPPYLRDVEVRLWEKQRDDIADVPSNEETEALIKRISQVKGELLDSIQQAEGLSQQLRGRRDSIIKQIDEADRFVEESNAAMRVAKVDVESIPERHWIELKSYRVPPKIVTQVIKAVMLLLLEDDANTWPQMQRVMRDFNFKDRITGYDAQELSPERREYILKKCVVRKDFTRERAMQGSVALGPIYHWVLAQLDVDAANTQKRAVGQEAAQRKKELRSVQEQIDEQNRRVAEYQELMDDLDDQLRICHRRASTAGSSVAPGRRSVAADRYARSFAAREGKEYLRQAFYSWVPTDHVIIVLRKSVFENLGPVTTQEERTGYNMSEGQIRQLDEALQRKLAELDELKHESPKDRQRRLAEEEHQLLDRDADAAERPADEDIHKQREQREKDGYPTPMPSPQNLGDYPVEEQVKDALVREFEGDRWPEVLERKHDQVANTFVEETAQNLKVPEYYVSVDNIIADEEQMQVQFKVKHNGAEPAEVLQERTDAFDYPRTCALYEEEVAALGDGEPEHQMKFGGDRWDDVASAHREEVLEAFLRDTSAATGAPREDIEVMDMRVEQDGLTVDYSIRNNDMTPEEVQDMVDAYDYPEVWAVYQNALQDEDQLSRSSGTLRHQVRFRGARWEALIDAHEDEIREAFTKDTANALRVAPSDIESGPMRYDRGLTIPYNAAGCNMSEDDIDQSVEDYKYPETWALYDRLLAEMAGAEHQKAFKGPYWESVLEKNRPELAEAFAQDTADALKVAPEQVDPRSLDTDQDRMLVSYNVDEPLTKEEVAEQTKDYDYPRTWSVYDNAVEELEAKNASMHQRFDGEYWPVVVKNVPEALHEAFIKDIVDCNGLQDPAQVQVKEVQLHDFHMEVVYSINKDGLKTADALAAAEEYPFPYTWELYEDPDTWITTTHQIGFDGEDWKDVLAEEEENLHGAFIRCTADLFGVPTANVKNVKMSIGSLIVDFDLEHPSLLTEAMIDERVAECPYEEVWELYKPRGKRGLGEEVVTAHEIGFEGLGWRSVLARRPAELRRAIQHSVADAVQQPPSKIDLTSVAYEDESLVVLLDVAHPAETGQDEIQDALTQHPFDEVWELYPEDADDFPADGMATTSHEVGFEGKDWAYTMKEDRQNVTDAFRQATAEVLQCDPEDLQRLTSRTNDEGLVMAFDYSHPAEQSEEDINRALADCPYESVWDLMQTAPYTAREVTKTSHEITFDGIGWQLVLAERLADLHEAVQVDTAAAMEVEPADIDVTRTRMADEQLIVRVRATHSVLQDNDLIKEQLSRCPYDNVWELYPSDEEIAAMAARGQDDAVSQARAVEEEPLAAKAAEEEAPLAAQAAEEEELARAAPEDYPVEEAPINRSFPGERWEEVLREKSPELVEAFQRDTAELFGGEPEDVEVEAIAADEEGLHVTASVRNLPESVADEATAQESVRAAPYEEVWKVYEEATGPIVSSHQVVFEEAGWEYVARRRRNDLVRAIATDTAAATGNQVDDVKEVQMAITDTEMTATVQLSHPREQTTEDVEQRMQEAPYERTWALYEHYAPSGPLTRHFAGDRWPAIVEEHGPAFRRAFAEDTAAAIHMSRLEVAVADVAATSEGVQVAYEVRSGLTPEDVQATIDAYPYPKVWALYSDLTTGTTEFGAPSSQKVFDGDLWDRVYTAKPAEVKAAFITDARDAAAVPKESVQVTSLYTTAHALVVNYKIAGDAAGEEREAVQAVDTYYFPTLWRLYPDQSRAVPPLPAGWVQTTHEVGFDGSDWAYVVANHKEELHNRFSEDTAERLQLGQHNICMVQPYCDRQMLVNFEVQHPKEMTADDVDEQLRHCPYVRVWELYGGKPELADDVETTTHDVGFEGEDWTYVMEKNMEGIREAVAMDTATALAIRRSDITVESVEPTDDGMLILLYIQHEPALEEERINEILKDAPYGEVWALYETPPYQEGDVITTKHAVDFEGDGWAKVREVHGEEIDKAIVADTAEALGVAPESVVDLRKKITKEALTARIKVEHSPLQDAELIQEMLQSHPYDRVWALYDVSMESAPMTKTFPGEGWPAVKREQPQAVEEAFRQDMGTMLSLPPRYIKVQKATATPQDGLAITYIVYGEWVADEEIAQHASTYPFPEVWALYAHPDGARGMTAFASEPATTKTFPGELWDEILRAQPQRVSEAVREDVAEATRAPVEDVKVTSVSTTPAEGLVAKYRVKDTPAEEVEAATRDAPFAQTHALYEEAAADREALRKAARVSRDMQRRFEGARWQEVLDEYPAEVEQDFRQDLCDCLEADANDVEVFGQKVGSLIMDYRIHRSQHEDDDIDRIAQNYHFPLLMARYRFATGANDAQAAEDARPKLHQITFQAPEWDFVMAHRAREVHLAIEKDTADALGLKNTTPVVDVQTKVTPDALIAYTTVEPQEGVSCEEMQRQLDAYDFPLTWDLYCPPSEAPCASKRFDGDRWQDVSPAALQRALQRDTAKAANVKPADVEVREMDTTPEGLRADLAVHFTYASEDAVAHAVETYPYPETWSLYQDPNGLTVLRDLDAGLTRSEHQVYFPGEQWQSVAAAREEALCEAFLMDAADHFDVPSRQVKDAHLAADKNGVEVRFGLAHDPELAHEEIEAQLKEAPFERVWAMYPSADDDKVTTRQEVGFEGDDWEYVWGKKEAQVREAFAKGVAEAMSIPPADVSNIVFEKSETGMVLTSDITHSNRVAEETVADELRVGEFTELWALYELGPIDFDERTHTKTSITFEGEAWDFVMRRKAPEVHLAAQHDTAEALGIPLDDVKKVHSTIHPRGMEMILTVHHGLDQDTTTIREDLTAYPFERVWDFYCPPEEAPTVAKAFPGDWAPAYADRQAALRRAFSADTAKALQVEPSDVEVLRMREDATNGLQVDARVNFSLQPQEEVDQQTENYPYPQVWALYAAPADAPVGLTDRGLAGATASGTQEFHGDAWALIMSEHRAEIRDAFREDAGEATGVLPEQVRLISLRPTHHSLLAHYAIDDAPYAPAEVKAEMAAAPYTRVWSFYEAHIHGEDGASTAAPALVAPVGTGRTSMTVSFDGDDWDYVVERKSAALTDAFMRETARALGVRKQDVTVTEFVLGSLLVHFDVEHPLSVQESTMRQKIFDHPYQEVWDLYEPRPAGGGAAARQIGERSSASREASPVGGIVATRHEVGFEADNWEYVMTSKSAAVKSVFQRETAAACGVAVEDVRNVHAEAFPQMLKITCDVAHSASESVEMINSHLHRCNYDGVWALYEDPPHAARMSAPQTKNFDGEAWEQVVQNVGPAVKRAFISDTAKALQVAPRDVQVRDVTTTSYGMDVEFTVRSDVLSEPVIERRTGAYPYPETWALYKPGDEGGLTRRGAPAMQRQFQGAAWDVVMAERNEDLRRAFKEDAAEVMEASSYDVEITSMYTVPEGLVVNYDSDKPGLDREATAAAVREGEFPKTWALYREYADEGFVQTKHSVGFDGADWSYTREVNEQVLLDTFKMCTAEALGLQSRHVNNINASTDAEGLQMDFSVLHPPELMREQIDSTLARHAYKPVWDLYETRPYDPSVTTVTSHEVRFDGEDWGYTVDARRSAVERAFAEDVSEALQLAPSDVRGVRIERTENGIVIGANVTHSPLLDDDMIKEELAHSEFPKTWAMYTSRPRGASDHRAASVHTVDMDGQGWEAVLARHPYELERALRDDTAAATGVAPEDVTDVQPTVTADRLRARVAVQHSPSEAEHEVQAKINRGGFPKTWALYDEVMQPQVDVLKTRQAQRAAPLSARSNVGMSKLMTKWFDGTDWDLVLDNNESGLRNAFIEDTADVLQCSSSAVRVEGMAIGSLIVQYRVKDLSMAETHAMTLADNYAYPRVWALYTNPTAGKAAAPVPESARGRSPLRSARATEAAVMPRSVAQTPRVTDQVDAAERAAAEQARDAQRAAEAAERAKEAAARRAAQAREEQRRAEEEADREEEAARQSIVNAQRKREAAQRAADKAADDEAAAKQRALEQAERALDAAQKAKDAAEEARRNRREPLGAEESALEEESIVYLRRALAEARQERDHYQRIVEGAEEDEYDEY